MEAINLEQGMSRVIIRYQSCCRAVVPKLDLLVGVHGDDHDAITNSLSLDALFCGMVEGIQIKESNELMTNAGEIVLQEAGRFKKTQKFHSRSHSNDDGLK